MRLFLIILMVQLALCIWEPPQRHNERVCETIDCQRRGQRYFVYKNEDVHPCNNFFEFACGNWAKYNNMPKKAPDWTVGTTLQKRSSQVIRSILEDPEFDPADHEFRLLKTVYETCIQRPSYPRKDAQDLGNKIREIGRYPETSVWELHNKYLRLTGESPFFDAVFVASHHNADHPLLVYTEPYSAYGSIIHVTDWTPSERAVYLFFLVKIMKSLQLGDTTAKIRERVEQVFEFRRSLNTLVRTHRVMPHVALIPIKLREMTHILSLPLLPKSREIPWKEMSRILLHSLPRDVRERQKVVDFRNRFYFSQLLELLEDTSDEVIANHIEIFFVERHLIFTNELYHLLARTSEGTHILIPQIRIDEYEWWEECINGFNGPDIVGRLYMRKYFPLINSITIDAMLKKVKNAMTQQMLRSTWLNAQTRIRVAHKLDSLIEWIGFPPPSAATDQDNMARREAMTPNGSLDILRNILYLRAALIAPPIFDVHLPAVYNYAGLGAAIGHELYHIIQDCGAFDVINLTTNTASRQVWWPPSMRRLCAQRKHCFLSEYYTLTKNELTNYGVTNASIDSERTFTEDMPDVMGLQAAFQAYRAQLREDRTACQTLPRFRNYSCDQMFFIAFANAFCEVNTFEAATHKVNTGKHSLGAVRVNGALANNYNFASAFSCPVGTPMNPRTKCNLWE